MPSDTLSPENFEQLRNEALACNNQEMIDYLDKLQQVAERAYVFTQLPLLKLIHHNTIADSINNPNFTRYQQGVGLSLFERFGVREDAIENTVVITKTDSEGKETKVSIGLGIVAYDYDLLSDIRECTSLLRENTDLARIDMDSLEEEAKDTVISIMGDLVQCAQYVFGRMKADVVELQEYQLLVSDNSTLYISGLHHQHYSEQPIYKHLGFRIHAEQASTVTE